MVNLRRFVVLLLVSLFCMVFAAGCDDVIKDPNFHTWCGDQLCSWKLESGEIRKVPTWHRNDFGVELLDSNAPNHVTAISQKVTSSFSFNIFSSGGPTCLEFSVIADVAAEAQVSIRVDFSADGEVEYEQPIAATGFREQKTQLTAPLHYRDIKFTISKKGTGRAVLAQMDVRSKQDCTAPPVQLKPQIMGLTCSGMGDEVCLSGVCCGGLCSECCPSSPPPHDEDGGLLPDLENKCGGATCATLRLPDGPQAPGADKEIPYQCEPGVRKRPAGAACLLDADCTNGSCSGADWTFYNASPESGTCAPPPASGPNCLVTSVRAGRCR